jgi:hypothetical protein
VDNSDAHCSFCGKGKDEVRKLIAGGGRHVVANRALPPVSICSECVAICANACAQDRADLESDLHAAAAELMHTATDVLQTPPPGYGSAPDDLKGLVMKLLVPVWEALKELEADRPYRGAKREITDEVLVEAQKRVWDLIDDLRRARSVPR